MTDSSLQTKNPALLPLSLLLGKWSVTMSHVSLPEPLTWQDSFEWMENAFILWRWQGKNEVPQSLFMISRNENRPANMYTLSSYDSRGVSRIFEMSFSENIWKFWREDSDFFQRFEGKVSQDGNSITGKGEMSHDKGKTWEHDFDITYTKIS